MLMVNQEPEAEADETANRLRMIYNTIWYLQEYLSNMPLDDVKTC